MFRVGAVIARALNQEALMLNARRKSKLKTNHVTRKIKQLWDCKASLLRQGSRNQFKVELDTSIENKKE